MKTPIPALVEYIKDAKRAKNLAHACGTTPDYLYQIAYGWRRAGQSMTMKIEQHADIPRRKIRPDWFARAA